MKSLNEEDFSKKSKKKPRESKAQSEEDSEIDLDPVSKGWGNLDSLGGGLWRIIQLVIIWAS